MADIFDIAGRINSTSQEKVVTTADQIKDETQNKKQNVINADVARHETEIHGTGGIDSRLSDVEQMEQIVIDGGDAQIATGADFTDPDATKRAKIPTVGAIVDGLNDGVYDVSKRNPTAGPNSDGKFTLDYILSNANTLIPTGWRHGGMTISFVDSSDNKYIQYRLMSDEWSTTASDWQGVDDKASLESANLTTSKGALVGVTGILNKVGWLEPIESKKGRMVKNTGVVTEVNTSSTYLYDVSKLVGTDICISNDKASGNNYQIFAFLTDDSFENGETVSFCEGENTKDVPWGVWSYGTFTVPADAKWLAVTRSYTYNSVVTVIDTLVFEKSGQFNSMREGVPKNVVDIEKLSFVKRSHKCLYNTISGSTGVLSYDANHFVTPILPIPSNKLIVKGNDSTDRYLVLYSEDLSTTMWYSIPNGTKNINNIDTTTYKYMRATFAQDNNNDCYIYDNVNKKYSWYGYWDYTKYLKNTADSPIIVFASGSKLTVNRINKTVTFPANTYIRFGKSIYNFSAITTISIPNNNGLLIFDPNNTSVDNGVKSVNYNYNLVGDERIICGYSMIYGYLNLPPYMLSFNDECIIDYDSTPVSFNDRLKAAKTAGKAEGSTVPLQLLWFSDIHGRGDRIRDMKDWISKRYITQQNLYDDVIATGDQVQINFNSDFDYWSTQGAGKYLQVIGNHDVWDAEHNVLSAQTVYERYFAPYISTWNVVSAGVNLCYYYKDYATNKIRLIVIDCMHYDDDQNTWLTTILEDARVNSLNVVIVSHYRADVPDYIECPFTSLSRGDGATTDARVCDAVNTFITNGGKFVCHLGGHTHFDTVYTCHNYPNQLGLTICCMADNQSDDEHQTRSNRFRNCFNFVSFDIDKKLVRILRPSCNMDRWNRAQNTLVVNYETRQLIYND